LIIGKERICYLRKIFPLVIDGLMLRSRTPSKLRQLYTA